MFDTLDRRLGRTETGEGASVDRGDGTLATPDNMMEAVQDRASTLARKKPFSGDAVDIEREIRIQLGNEMADAYRAEFDRVSNEEQTLKEGRDARAAEAEAEVETAAAADAESFVEETLEKDPAPDSPAFTTQKDIETAFLLQLSMLKENKELQETEELNEIRKAVLVEDYINATLGMTEAKGHARWKPGKVLSKKAYNAMLENAEVTLEDLGLDTNHAPLKWTLP